MIIIDILSVDKGRIMFVMGRVECGSIREGNRLFIMLVEVLSSMDSFDFLFPSDVFLFSFYMPISKRAYL